MSAACKTFVRTSFFSIESILTSNHHRVLCSLLPTRPPHVLAASQGPGLSKASILASRCFASTESAVSLDASDFADEDSPLSKDDVERLLADKNDVARLMKMERREAADGDGLDRWFPYLDRFKCGGSYLSSGEVLEALGPHIMDVRKERFRSAVTNRSYSVCLVVEGLCDFGNVSAAFRSADALGFQSVHVVSWDSSKRCCDNP